MDLRFLADLNISPQTVESLRQRGWDVIRASDRLPPTAPDAQILEVARREGRVVITQDLDFSALVALAGQSQPSLITLRLSDSAPGVVTGRLVDSVPLVEQELRSGAAVTIDDMGARVRGLPIR